MGCRKKDEDIERTFRGVAMHFKEIFNEIVQTGKGELVMIKVCVELRRPCFFV